MIYFILNLVYQKIIKMKAYEERPKSAFSEKDTIANLKTPLTNGEKWVATTQYKYGNCKQKVIKENVKKSSTVQ